MLHDPQPMPAVKAPSTESVAAQAQPADADHDCATCETVAATYVSAHDAPAAADGQGDSEATAAVMDGGAKI